jgi:hypothetical protein
MGMRMRDYSRETASEKSAVGIVRAAPGWQGIGRVCTPS